jgi:hypothetical protein
MVIAGFVGVRPGGLWHPSLGDVRDIVINQSVERHNAADRAHRDIGLRQQAPDPELTGVWMRLLQVVHLHHAREPDLAGRLLGAPFFVQQSHKVLGLKALNPGVDRRAGDLQKTADTALLPALIVEFDHLEAGLVAIRMGVIVPQL